MFTNYWKPEMAWSSDLMDRCWGVSSRGDMRESALSLSFTLLLSAESLALTQHGHTLWLAGAPMMRTCLAG